MTQIDQLPRLRATELLSQALAGRSAGAQLSVVSSEDLGSAAGRRSVVRYTVDGLDPSGPVRLIAKTFSEPRRAQLLSAHLAALSNGPFAAGRYRVPRLLAFVPEENLVLFQECTGTPLDEVVDHRGALDGARDAARWLAELHLSSVQLPRTFDTLREVTSTHAWAAAVGRHSPQLLKPAQRLASLWATIGPPSTSGAQVPIHKDFHAGHVLLGDGTCVIDLDEARVGDPALDLAHFCTYLELRPGGRRGALLRRAFLEEYVAAGGRPHEDRELAPFAAYTWLKIAKQLGGGQRPDARCRRAGAPARRGRGAEEGSRVPGPVIYLVRSWPRLSQTFIVDEVLALERRGVDLALFSLVRLGRAHRPSPGRAGARGRASPRSRRPVAPALGAHVAVVVPAPRRYATTPPGSPGAGRDLATGYATSTTCGCFDHAVRGRGDPHPAAGRGRARRRTCTPTSRTTRRSSRSWSDRLTGVPFSFTAHARDLSRSRRRSLAARAGRPRRW